MGEVEPNRLQAAHVQALHVERRGLEDHLELVVLAEAERVVAIAAVGGPARRLDVGHPPRLGPEHTQESVRMHGARPDLQVERLLEHAAFAGPEFGKLEDQLLERLHVLSSPASRAASPFVSSRAR